MSSGQTALTAMEAPHASHPSAPRLMLLVFSAICEVVCTCLPGYILARRGFFTRSHQKFLGELNMNLFTPCLSMPCLPTSLPLAPHPLPALSTRWPSHGPPSS